MVAAQRVEVLVAVVAPPWAYGMLWSSSRWRSTSQPSIEHVRPLGADPGRERGRDRPAEGHDAGDVGALHDQGLDDRVGREPAGGADRDGPAPSISQISPGGVPASVGLVGDVEVQRGERPTPRVA